MREYIRRVKAEWLFSQQLKDYEEVVQESEYFWKDFHILRELYERSKAEGACWEEQYVIIAQVGEDNIFIILTLYKEYMRYKDKHEKLSFLTNNLINDIPRSLKDAEDTMVSLPKNVEDFLKLYREMVDCFRA